MAAPNDSTGLVSISIHAPGHFVALKGEKEHGKGPICLVVEGPYHRLPTGFMMKIKPTPAPPPPPPFRELWELTLEEDWKLQWTNSDGKSSEPVAGPLTCYIYPMGPMTMGLPDNSQESRLGLAQFPR